MYLKSRNESALNISRTTDSRCNDCNAPLLAKKTNKKLLDLSEKVLRLNDDETGLGKYFRTKLEPNGKGGLIAKVQPIIATYGNPLINQFQDGVKIKLKRTKKVPKTILESEVEQFDSNALSRLQQRFKLKTQASDQEDSVDGTLGSVMLQGSSRISKGPDSYSVPDFNAA